VNDSTSCLRKYPKEQVDMVKSLGLSRGEEEKILWKNAGRLFRIV
jgi:predicted TIM-barrel fold metal-dependent hydrolase